MFRPVHTGWRGLALVAAVLLVVAACGGDEDGDTAANQDPQDQAVAIAFVGALTGDNANLGINIRDGAKVAVEQANEQAGVEIQLKEFDTQGSSEQAGTIKERFLNDPSILGLVGPAFSGETKAVLPSLQEQGLVMISPSATAADIPTVVPGQTVFHRIVADDNVQGQGLTEYVTRKLNAKTAGYVHDNSDYGKGLSDGTQELLEGAGVNTVVSATVDPRSQDFSAAVNSVKNESPEVIFYGGYYAEAGRLQKQLKDAGVDTTFLSGDGALDAGFVTAAGAPSAEGAVITCVCRLATPDAPGPLGEFARSYSDLIGKDPGTYSTEGYDAANILIRGIREGKRDRASLLDFVETLGLYEGASKTIDFEPDGNIKVGGAPYIYEVKAGKINTLGTVDEVVG